MPEGRIIRLDETHLAFLCTAETLCFGESAWPERILRETLTNPFSYFLGIFIDDPVPDTCVGYLAVRILGTEAEVLSIAVLPEYRGCGFAQRLLEYWWNNESYLQEVFLEVRVSNMPAIGLYQKLGFVPLGYRKNYYFHPQEDALMMKKQFPPVSPGPVGAELFT